MVNVLASSGGTGWRMIVFPRRKHRPAAFFREGADKILVSPAAVDMGGLVITPVEKDFDSLTQETMDEIYHEVSLGRETIVECLRGIL